MKRLFILFILFLLNSIFIFSQSIGWGININHIGNKVSYWGNDTTTPVNGNDIDIAKYDLSENVVWFHTMGGTQSSEVYSLSSDSDANIYYDMKDSTKSGSNKLAETGPWDKSVISILYDWDPKWIEQCLKMSNGPWTGGILPRKEVELISLAVNAACTNLNAEGTRRHIRGSLEAGASREEILMIIRIASLLSIHTTSLGAPILLDEAKIAGVKMKPREFVPTPVCDKMKAAGQWNTAWDGFYDIDPAWTEAIISVSLPVYTSGVLSPRLAELLSIAVDASITHMYVPGTRRHIQSALKLGVTIEEIMEVLKICVSQGMQSSNLAIPILVEELQRFQKKEK